VILQSVLATLFSSVFSSVYSTLLRIFHTSGQNQSALPEELRRYFTHLYWDVAWFGIVAGSSQAFLGVYVARLGATPLQMGLLNAGPALVGLLFTMPAGVWLRNKPVGRVVFGSAVVMRLQFLLWAFLPGMLPAQGQVWSFIALVLLFTVPATVLAIAFNAMYAAAVPIEHRHRLAALRNALLALVYVATSLVSGWLLDTLPMTWGYRVIFVAGFIGAAMSAYHLYHLRHITTASITEPEKVRGLINDMARPGELRTTGLTVRGNVAIRVFSRGLNLMQVEVLRGSYGRIVAALFAFHFAQFLPIPVMPLFWVGEARFSDWEIGIGTAVFHAAVLLGSLQFVRVAKLLDNRRWTAVSAVFMALYPLLSTFTYTVPMLVVTSIAGGAAWSVTAATLGTYLLEQAPEADRPAALAWYNLALNAAVLSGSLIGSLLGETVGIIPALLLAALLRALSGLALWKWY
jgi:MFS family permease